MHQVYSFVTIKSVDWLNDEREKKSEGYQNFMSHYEWECLALATITYQ